MEGPSSSLKFGTSGLRGLVTDLIGGPAYDHAAAFLRALGANGPAGSAVLIGRDLRSSSPAIAGAVAAAVHDAGLRPLDCGVLPTPALALEAMRRTALAVMVTGSHIPDDSNGLKFYTAAGEITKADERAITGAFAATAASPDIRDGDPHPDALDLFRSRSIAAFAPDALEGLRVGVYQQSSAARDLLVEVIEALGGEPVPFGRSEAFVPIDTEAHRPEDLAMIRDATATGTLDAVVTTDGDGDRPLVADAVGRVLPGDIVGTIAARYLGIAAVAVPVTAGSAIERSGSFARTIRTRVGSPFVIAGMEQALALGLTPVAGFESNGGFLLGSALSIDGRQIVALPTRDSILPIVATLAATRAAGIPLSALAASLGFRATVSHRLQQIPAALSGPFLQRLLDPEYRSTFVAALGGVSEVDVTDGVRIGLKLGGAIHFRASGNAPELRCYAEANTSAQAEEMVAWGLRAAQDAMGCAGTPPC